MVWDGRDEQGNLVPLGDYQLLFYTANHAGLFGSYTAAFRVVDALPVGGVAPTSAPLAPIEPPDDAPWLLTPDPSAPTLPAPMAAAIDRMTGEGQSQAGQSPGADTSLAALSRLAGARAGQSASSTAGLGTAALLALAASYLVAQQANGKLDLGKQLAELSAAWKPSAKPAAPPVPKVAPPVAPPPPPPSKPRPKPLRWNQIRHTPPAPPPPPPPPPPKPVWYPPPKTKPSPASTVPPYVYYAYPGAIPKPKPVVPPYVYYAYPGAIPKPTPKPPVVPPYVQYAYPQAKPKPIPKPHTSSYDYYANPWPTKPKPPTPSYTYYANPWPTKPPVVPPVPASKHNNIKDYVGLAGIERGRDYAENLRGLNMEQALEKSIEKTIYLACPQIFNKKIGPAAFKVLDMTSRIGTRASLEQHIAFWKSSGDARLNPTPVKKQQAFWGGVSKLMNGYIPDLIDASADYSEHFWTGKWSALPSDIGKSLGTSFSIVKDTTKTSHNMLVAAVTTPIRLPATAVTWWKTGNDYRNDKVGAWEYIDSTNSLVGDIVGTYGMARAAGLTNRANSTFGSAFQNQTRGSFIHPPSLLIEK